MRKIHLHKGVYYEIWNDGDGTNIRVLDTLENVLRCLRTYLKLERYGA